MFKLQACLFFHILFQKKQSHCINWQSITAHLNLPGSQNRSKYQCVFVALQRSTQCHLQCISTFGNVAFNLFQPMKWIRRLTSLRGSWVRYKERLLLKPEKAFDVNVVDQHSALIILLPKFIFYCWYKLILTSLAIGPQHRSRWHFWVLSWVCTIQMLICGADDSDPESSSFSLITNCRWCLRKAPGIKKCTWR